MRALASNGTAPGIPIGTRGVPRGARGADVGTRRPRRRLRVDALSTRRAAKEWELSQSGSMRTGSGTMRSPVRAKHPRPVAIERNVVTVRASRPELDSGRSMIAAERVRGVFRRQVMLGDSLDTDRIRADYRDGVLRLRFRWRTRRNRARSPWTGWKPNVRRSTPDREPRRDSGGVGGGDRERGPRSGPVLVGRPVARARSRRRGTVRRGRRHPARCRPGAAAVSPPTPEPRARGTAVAAAAPVTRPSAAAGTGNPAQSARTGVIARNDDKEVMPVFSTTHITPSAHGGNRGRAASRPEHTASEPAR